MIRSFEGVTPDIAESARVDERAVVIGDVTIKAEANVWPGAVLRGDEGSIVLQKGCNIQDNATLHEHVEIGPYSTVGHNAIVHNATIGRRSMIGMGAIVLDDSYIGAESLVGANSVVVEETEVPDSVLVVGAPAEVVKKMEDSPWTEASDHYIELAKRHEESSKTIE